MLQSCKNPKTKKAHIPRVLIAAPSSGSGKTLVTCGLLKSLQLRALSPVACKCGPDFIDPMFHKKALGIDSSNLDSYMMPEKCLRASLIGSEGHYLVMEGVMGLYDGLEVRSICASSYEIARITQTPVILTMDASGSGRTLISLIKGILGDDSNRLIKGILLNKITPRFYESLAPVIREELKSAGYSARLIGYIPRSEELHIDSRHLGLISPQEAPDTDRKISRMSELLEQCCDMSDILDIMEKAPDLSRLDDTEGGVLISPSDKYGNNGFGDLSEKPLLAVAYDEAFDFYYKDNLELLEKLGLDIRYFSPIKDKRLPEGTSGILIGGGYPELYARELSENRSMLESIREAVLSGMPGMAECGGFMYLHEHIADRDGALYPMAGVIKGDCVYAGHPVRLGYLEITGEPLRQSSHKPELSEKNSRWYKDITGIRGHEFHYYESTCTDHIYRAVKPSGERSWDCMTGVLNMLCGFPHFYYGSNPDVVKSFVVEIMRYRGAGVH